MPNAAPHPCGQSRCSAVVPRGTRYCPAHLKATRKADDDRRGSAGTRGYDAVWRKARLAHLRRHPLCVFCQEQGRVTAASVVDHIVPISKAPDRRLDQTNLRSLCKPCHDSRTARDQAWGRGGRKFTASPY